MRHRTPLSLVSVGLLAAVLPSEAHASGGTLAGGASDTVHNTVVAISATQTTVIEQVELRPGAGSLVWILPVRGEHTVSSSSAGLLKTLALATPVTVRQPANSCFSGGCPGDNSTGSGEAAPYPFADEVLLPSELTEVADDAELATWLSAQGVTAPPDAATAYAAYAAEGYGFVVALYTAGQSDVRTIPIRVTSQRAAGDALIVPLRLALTGADPETRVNVTVIADQRYQPSGAAQLIDERSLEWNWDMVTSNYDQVRSDMSREGWLAEVGEPLSPFVFDALVSLAASDPFSSGYGLDGSDPGTAAQQDVAALRNGLDSGATWISRLSTLVPASGFAADLVLTPAATFAAVDRDLVPGIETGAIPDCGDSHAGNCFDDGFEGDDFVDEGMGGAGESGGCSVSATGRATGGAAAALLALALGLRFKRRLIER